MMKCTSIYDEAKVLTLGELIKSDHPDVVKHAEAIMQLVTANEICPRFGQTVLSNKKGMCSLSEEHEAVTPMKEVSTCAPNEKPYHAEYVCDVCGMVEGMGADDSRNHLTHFSTTSVPNSNKVGLICSECGSSKVTCHYSAKVEYEK